MKKIMVVLFLLLSLVIIGCGQKGSVEESTTADSRISMNTSEPIADEQITAEGSEEIAVQSSLPPNQCAAGWKCISSQIKAYRSTNCSFGQRVQCPLGCLNDTCKAASVCTSGFKCINDHRKGYQTEACTWINDLECPGGCEEGECLFYNASAVEDVAAPAATAASSPPPDNSKTLRLGQQETITINEEEHILTLYILEPSRVKFSVDGFKTDWLEEGDSATIRGVTLDVKEILFQSFSGGKQEVRYTVE